MNQLRNSGRYLERTSSSGKAVNETDPVELASDHQRAAVLLRAIPPWLVSTLFHIAMLLVLAILTLTHVADKQVSLILEPATTADTFTDITVLKFDDLDVEQDSTMEDMLVPEDLSTTQPTSPLALPMARKVEFSDFGAGLDQMIDGLESLGENTSTTRFFGTEQSAQRVVFVVDNSNSMSKGKFETALTELKRTVGELSPKQQFHVIFFSDTAYLMFHPRPVRKLVPATDKNKERLTDWLDSVEMCLKTKGEDAMKAAIEMQPDVIYILGDGAFTDQTEARLTARHDRKIVINTLGMQVDPRGKRQLVAIAKANHGTYRDVEAAPLAAKMARQNPIQRNNIRGRIWGITLPLEPKQK